MFENEKKEWNRFFNYYKGKFGEDVGIRPAAYEDDHYEIDFVIGEDSDKILGFRIINYIECEVEEKKKKKKKKKDEEEEENIEVFSYELVRNIGKILGKPIIKLSIDDEDTENDNNDENHNDQLSITIYSEDGKINSDITCAVLVKTSEPDKQFIFGSDPEFE